MAFIGAVATIVAAVIAGVAAVSAGAVEVRLPDDSDEASDLGATVTSLRDVNEALQEDNARLERELEAAQQDDEDGAESTGTTPTTSGTPSEASSVRRETSGAPLTFTWAYSADLDTEDVDWGVVEGTPSGWDLYLDGDGSVSTLDVVLMDHVPTEAECRDATVRQPSLRDEQSVVGAMMCVQTTEDRFAFVRIADVDEERRTTSVDVVVWE